MCDNVQKCCRICLDVESDHVPILGDPTISLHLKSCLAMTVSSNDQLPKTICVSCVSLLNQFYNFQLNARCSQDWLESSIQEKLKRTSENKMPLQPLPDSEYNSDSLLEFLNNTANIEEYLNNLGKEDIPCIVNMLDKNEHSNDIGKFNNKCVKVPSPKKRDTSKKFKTDNDICVSDFKIVKEFIKQEMEQKNKNSPVEIVESSFVCYGCKVIFESVQKLLQHMSVCDLALRTCVHCDMVFGCKQQLHKHSLIHNTSPPLSCNCGEQFPTKEKLIQHHKICNLDYGPLVGYVYRCKECGDTFKERFQLYKHAKEHILKTEERICDICGHSFIGSDALVKHKKDEHETPEDVSYRCKICSVTMSDRKQMYLHVKNHSTKLEPTRHLCESCGRSFSTRPNLLRHTATHAKDRPTCSICRKTFNNINALNDHSMEHIQVVMCEKCGQNIDRCKLNEHLCE